MESYNKVQSKFSALCTGTCNTTSFLQPTFRRYLRRLSCSFPLAFSSCSSINTTLIPRTLFSPSINFHSPPYRNGLASVKCFLLFVSFEIGQGSCTWSHWPGLIRHILPQKNPRELVECLFLLTFPVQQIMRNVVNVLLRHNFVRVSTLYFCARNSSQVFERAVQNWYTNWHMFWNSTRKTPCSAFSAPSSSSQTQ